MVEIVFRNDKIQGKILCGLVHFLPYGVDILVGNDLNEIMPLAVSVVTRAGTDTTNIQTVVRREITGVKSARVDYDDCDDVSVDNGDVDVDGLIDWNDLGDTTDIVGTNRSASVDQTEDLAPDLSNMFTDDLSPYCT